MERSLTRQMTARLTTGMLTVLVLATPLLYYLTMRFYAEDLMEIVRRYGIRNPSIDLEQDVMAGVFIQFFIILGGMLAAIFLVMQFVPCRLWRPFHQTLNSIKDFKVEEGAVWLSENTGVREFSQLNATLNLIMHTSVRSYQVQKEFTENASHELQTPLAIVQNKIDNLLQDEHLTEHQAREMQEMYRELRHMSNLSRSLLLLSKIENNQFRMADNVNLCRKINDILPRLESLAGSLPIATDYRQSNLTLVCNDTLLESLITNLVVNAVRHNRAGGNIIISVADKRLTVANTSDERPLDAEHIFSRFYRTQSNQKGNGLGLAIVKSICNYHHWQEGYHYKDGLHVFTVDF
ncbi:HAMP domain-containing sensor histidine kinase [Hoylesella oralis]|uniref:sensor histidine kinase n=1 Tax=Hoylesella oralis TaxID=28134 RepID=UPI0028E38FD4|nr:HAMP domain-containing sensor histidine kinase [Hoylesella oralis]